MKPGIQKIETAAAPKAIGPYSQAVVAEGLVFVSGQLPIHPSSGKIADPSFEGQVRQVFDNLKHILAAAGVHFSDVLRVEIFLKDLNDYPKMNEIYAEKFSGAIKPARQAIQAARLPMDALVEISCIASKRSI